MLLQNFSKITTMLFKCWVFLSAKLTFQFLMQFERFAINERS